MDAYGTARLQDCIRCPLGAFWSVFAACVGVTQYAVRFTPASAVWMIHTHHPERLTCPPLCRSELASTQPTRCQEGTFRNTTGGTTRQDCMSCLAGSACASQGMGAPVPCGCGEYSGSGARFCSPCIIGFYCPSHGLAEATMRSTYYCPAGLHCIAGMAQAPSHFVDACPRGRYCVRGDVDPFPRACPAGTYQPMLGPYSRVVTIRAPRPLARLLSSSPVKTWDYTRRPVWSRVQ